MEPGQKEGSGLPLSGIVVLLTILGVIFVQQIPLKPTRPFAPQQPTGSPAYGEQVVPARLWQDPFSAVSKYRGQRTTPAASSIQGLVAITPAATEDAAEEPHQKTPAQLTLVLESESSSLAQPSPPHDAATLRASVHKRLVGHSPQGSSNDEPKLKVPGAIVLGVMVFAGPYAEPAEIRTRWRYAVLSALDVAGYVPDDAQHIGYFVPDAQTPGEAGGTRLPSIVPFEWFESVEKNRPPVLVLWIDDGAVGSKPLASLAQLVAAIDPSQRGHAQDTATEPALSVRILGPAGSTTLKAMVDEARTTREKPASGFVEFEIYSATATAADCLLLGEPWDPPAVPANEQNRLANVFKARGIRFLRTVGTDDELARALGHELCLRHIVPGVATVWPNCGSGQITDPGRRDPKPRSTSHIVLISEWDTFYGRSLPATMINEFCQRAQRALDAGHAVTLNGSPDPQEVCNGNERSWVHRFSYMRGLDGQTAGQNDSSNGTKGNNTQANGQSETFERERPVGASQFDYLRRLAEQIARLNYELREKDKGRVRAIGVLGSDPYDKQLILQALRPRFTNIVFFTTDLDARLLFPSDFRWNRNLIVASSFGLRLHSELQRHIPPFRDGYQTALYFSGLLALNGGRTQPTQSQLNEWIVPRTFEVSRQGAFDLSMDNEFAGRPLELVGLGKVSVLYPEGSPFFLPERTRKALPWVAAFIVLLLVALSTETKRAMWRTVSWTQKHYFRAALAVVLALLFGDFLFDKYTTIREAGRAGEPFSFLSGISAWPSMLLKFLVVVLGAYYLLWMRLTLRWSEDDAHTDWGLPQRVRLRAESFQEAQHDRSSRGWGTRIRTALANLVSAWRRLTIFHWRRADEERTGDVKADSLWQEYLHRSTWPRRLARTFVPFVAYMGLFVAILIISERPNIPIRGLTEYRQLFFLVMFASFVLMSFITFVVVDATRLCRRFIELLSQLSIRWSKQTLDVVRHRFPASEDRFLGEWIKIQVIAQRAAAVTKLIYYPFILLFLMILARISYFDLWDMPLGISISYAVIAFYALYCAVILQRAAELARKQALQALNGMLIEAHNQSRDKTNTPKEISLIMDSIKSIRHGAFLPLPQQPVVKVLLLPFGALGLALLNYLTLSG